jgi:nucleotide-binding universal stress UspA family protein
LSTTNSNRRNVWLLALDGSPSADNAARYVARASKAFGLDALQLVNARFPGVGDEELNERARQARAREDAERATTKARAILERAGVPFRLEAPVGSECAALIVAAAEQYDVTEIVMGTRGVGRLASVTLGSVAYKVLHLTRRSVTLVPDRARSGGGAGQLHALLIAVDGSSSADRATQFVARQYGGFPKLRVVLLNVQPQIVSGGVRRFISKAEIDRYTQAEGEAAIRASVRILEKAGIAHEHRVVRGPAPELIMDNAADAGCGRIVLGTRGRGAAKSVLLGSVAYGVVHHAAVPVTVVDRWLPSPVLLKG